MFNANDKERIWTAIALERKELEAGSILSRLIAELEEFDTKNGTALVAKVQGLLTESEACLVELNALKDSGDEKVKRLAIVDEMQLEFEPHQSDVAKKQNDCAAIAENIRRLIDPNNKLGAIGWGMSRVYAN
jgi:hypothetical protein